MESELGHTFKVSDMWETYRRYETLDNEIINRVEKKQKPPVHVCDYDWRASHRASKTERELSVICKRMEMPGYGPKAAMVKFLDTGAIEYEDLYASGLEMICYRRGIALKGNAKKDEMVRLLKEADEAEAE